MSNTPSYPHNWVITLNVTENPKHKYGANGTELKSYKRFALYRNGMSVADYKAAVLVHPAGGKGYGAADLIWDSAPQRNFITVRPPGTAATAALPAIPDTPINAALVAAALGVMEPDTDTDTDTDTAAADMALAATAQALGVSVAPGATYTRGQRKHARR